MAPLLSDRMGRDLVCLLVLAVVCSVTSALLSIWVAAGPMAALAGALVLAAVPLGMMGEAAVVPTRLLRWKRAR
ncbi:MAG: hypothetical protein ACYDHB_00960 [Candidatus Dormibacteria bacterium]